MKRLLVSLISVLLVCLCLVCFTACSCQEEPAAVPEAPPVEETPEQGGGEEQPEDVQPYVPRYVEFGLFPQELKEQSVTVSQSANAQGYYLGSDDKLYVKVVADPWNEGFKFSNGVDIINGEEYYFQLQPITWQILSEENGVCLMVCRDILINKSFDNTGNDYAQSELREWLNNKFINSAFTQSEKELIQLTNVDSIQDKVFLLNYLDVVSEAYGYNSDLNALDSFRQKKTSDYSRANGAWMATSEGYFGNGNWWLRSAKQESNQEVKSVYSIGNVDSYRVSDCALGVVPVLRVELPQSNG